MPDRNTRPVLILFAKTPLPGRAKTRLMPPLDAEQAAHVAEMLIRLTAELATERWPGRVHLSVWPDTAHPLFRELARQYPLTLSRQTGNDLGQRMEQALRAFTSSGTPAAVMGCDVPHCPADVLPQAYDLLTHGRNVIGPCTDGGYYLLGLQAVRPEIFDAIPWGGRGVLAATRRRAAACGVALEELMTLRDVDSFEDLRHAARVQPALSRWTRNDKSHLS